MKKLILTALLFAGIATAGFSQDKQPRERKTPEQRAQLMTDHLNQKLSLSESQRSEIYAVNLQRAKEFEKMHADKSENKYKKHAKGKNHFKAGDDKIERILNDNQKKAYAQLKEEHKNKMKQHKGGFKKRPEHKQG